MKLDLPVWQLSDEVNFVGFGGVTLQNKGYTRIRLRIPGIKEFDKDVLLFVQPDSDYTKTVPVLLGTNIIDFILEHATKEELNNLEPAWGRGSIRTLVETKQLELDKIAEFQKDSMTGKVDHYVRLTRNVTLCPMQGCTTTGIASIPILVKRLNIAVDCLEPAQALEGVEVIPSIGYFKKGSSRLTIALRNDTRDKITLKKGTKVGRVMATNIVPPALAPNRDGPEIINLLGQTVTVPMENTNPVCIETGDVQKYDNTPDGNVQPLKSEPTPERLNALFSKLDLSGVEEWSEDHQQQIHDLMVEYQHLFALNDLELGCTDKVKHKIKLDNTIPFKDRYRRIPPHQFDEVRDHLQEMLKIGAIRKSVSPWASPVVLVCKKDGSLRFCIDLRKLNSRTIKDAYSLPRIEESLDCLNGAKIFTSLDLKSGYWQVPLDEESIPLTAFTVGPLGFYECVRMPFGLTNAPATFQRLMESCLGDLHLKYCIIYLDDIIFFKNT